MPDATHALVPLSGKHLAMSLTNEHYDETKQWRDHNGGEAKISPFQTKLAKVSATDVTGNMIFGRLYLVSGLRNIALIVTMPSAPTSPPLNLQLFLDFCSIFFPC